MKEQILNLELQVLLNEKNISLDLFMGMFNEINDAQPEPLFLNDKGLVEDIIKITNI